MNVEIMLTQFMARQHYIEILAYPNYQAIFGANQ